MVNYEEMYDGIFDGKLRYMAEDIYNRRNQLSANITEEEFKENVNLTRQYIHYLFYANPDKLVELLSFDAYSLFFKSNKNISPVVCDFGSTDRELVDMVARESDFEQEYSVSGRLTKYHVDSSTGRLDDLLTYAFWGSLNIQYENKIVGKIKKAYYFSKGGKLSVTVNINDKEYIEEISLLPDTMLSYEVSRIENGEKIPIISTDERYLEGVVNAYIFQHQDEEIKVLFPQIFKKEYFEDYTVPVRTRE